MCTAVRFVDGEDNMFFGRNLDWSFSYGEKVLYTPKDYNYQPVFNGEDRNHAVLGIGINLRLDRAALPDEVRAVAGALSDFTDTVPRRAALAAVLLRELERVYRLLNAGDTAAVVEEYRALLCCLDRPVRVVSPVGSYDAVCRGVNEQGNLIVERPDGTRDTLSSGEISIRL